MKSLPLQALAIFFSGLFLFTIGQSQEVIGFESRFYVFILEMWRHGLSGFPTVYSEPYPDYPVTFTFLSYLSAKLLGGVTRFSALYPTALASAATLAFTYLIGALYNRIWGMAAVLFLLFTYAFVTEARSISLDQFTTVVTVACFYLVSSRKVLKKSSPYGWLMVLFVLGFAFRGPLGLVVPVGVVSVFYLLEKEFKKFFFIAFMSAILLLICSAILLSLAHQVGGMPFLQEVLDKEVLGRMQDDVKTPAFYFYFVESFGAYAVTYPLAVAMLLGLLPKMNYSPGTRFLRNIFGWALVILIGLSIPGDKKVRYILAAAPAFALICGYLFVAAREQTYLYLLKRLFVWVCYLFPLLGLIAVYELHQIHPEILFSYHGVLAGLCFLFVIMFLVHRRELFAFGVAVLSFFVVLISVIEPINVDLNKTHEFVQQVELLREKQHAALAFYHLGRDGLAIKYMANITQDVQPLFPKTEADLKKMKKPIVVMAREEDYEQLPKKLSKHFSVAMRGKLGREPMVVLTLGVNKK
jgi:4-amino-4-deoxy-L-arabinose transferase-like glycosyltransferase